MSGAVEIPTGHTPGPWFAKPMGRPEDGEIFICTGVPGDDGGSIFEGGGVMGDDAENAANAALMALAPDMATEIVRLREALTACLDWMEETRACGDCGNWDWQEGDAYTVGRAELATEADNLCGDCPPVGWFTDKVRCDACPRAASWEAAR